MNAGMSSSQMYGSSSVTNLPDFASISQQNMRQVFSGKNPKALARNSEIWYHTKLSNERLARVAKGHKFWGVISDQKTSGTVETLGVGESAFESSYGEGTNNEEAAVPIPHDPYQAQASTANAAAEAAKKLEEMRRQRTYRTLNGMRFDVENHSTVHYGMSFIILNMAEEIMCVDRENKVKVKPLQSVKHSDRVLYKLVDLTEISNPGPVTYGRSMWFQLWDSELTNTTDFVLGSKVAELPSTVHIKLPGLDGIEEQAAKEKEENEASSEALKAREGDVDAAARAATKKFRLSIPQHPGPSRGLSPPSSSRASSFVADSHGKDAPDLGTSERNLDPEEDGEVGHSHDDKGKTTNKNHGHNKRTQATSSSTSATQAALPRKSIVVEECGGLQAVPVSDKSRQMGGPPADNGQHTRRDGSAVQDTARTQEQATAAATNLRFHTKSSFYLAKWIPRCATIPQTKDTMLKTNMPIYLEQDIYCLAASLSNSEISQWPKRFEDFADEKMLSELNMGTKSRRAMDKKDNEARRASMLARAGLGQQRQGNSVPTTASAVMTGAVTVKEATIVTPRSLVAAASSTAHDISGISSSNTFVHNNYRTSQASGVKEGIRHARGSTDRQPSNADGNALFGIRTPAQILASLPPGAFRSTVPALYPQSNGNYVDTKWRNEHNTVVDTVDTADSRYAADLAVTAEKNAQAAENRDGSHKEDSATAMRAAALQAAKAAVGKKDGNDGCFGCVRKIVLRGPPYEMSVDKRCVWRLCVVEDVSSKNDDDFLAAKVMQRARRALQKSEEMRKGAIQHDTGKDGMAQVKGGEAFARALRLVTTASNYQGETLMLHPVRQKEVHLREHFEDIMFGEEFMRKKRADELKAREDAARDFGNVFIRTSHQGNRGYLSGSSAMGVAFAINPAPYQQQISQSNSPPGGGSSSVMGAAGGNSGTSINSGTGAIAGMSRSPSRHIALNVTIDTNDDDKLKSSANSVGSGSRGRSPPQSQQHSNNASTKNLTTVAGRSGLSQDALNVSLLGTEGTPSARSPSQPVNNNSYSSPFCTEATCGEYAISSMDPDNDLDDYENQALALLSDRRLDIFVVDDDLAERFCLRDRLRSEGHMVFEAINGQDALYKYQRLRAANERYFGYAGSSSQTTMDFDCILLDLVMPEMDGARAVAELRASGYTGIVLGMVGASGAAAGLEVFKAYGADEVLLKPVSLHTFHLAMLGLLAQRLRDYEQGKQWSSSSSSIDGGLPAGAGMNAIKAGGQPMSSSVSVGSHSQHSGAQHSNVAGMHSASMTMNGSLSAIGAASTYSHGKGKGSALARNSRHTRSHTGTPSNEQHSVAVNYSVDVDGNHSASYVEERENLAELFAQCESFGERVSSTRTVLYNIGAKVEAGVRVAFEEQKRKEALEIAKLKKAGHHVTSAGGLTPVSIKRVTSSSLEVGGDLGNNITGRQDPGSPSKSTADILAMSTGYGPSSDSAAAIAAYAKDKERMTLHLKKMKMAAADEEVQSAMSHKAKMLKSLLAQDFYAQRDKHNREKFSQHKSNSSMNVIAAAVAGVDR